MKTEAITVAINATGALLNLLMRLIEVSETAGADIESAQESGTDITDAQLVAAMGSLEDAIDRAEALLLASEEE